MPGWPLRKNEAGTLPVLVFPIYDADGDLVSAAASLDSERSIDQNTFADTTAEATEIATASGMYSLAPTQAELNGDEIAFITKTGTAGAKTAVNVLYTSDRNIDDLQFPTVSGRSVDVLATGEVGIDLDNTQGTLDAAQIGADAITEAKIADNAIAAAIAANAIGASEMAVGAFEADVFAAGAIDDAAMNADAFDGVFLRDIDNVEVAAPVHSLAVAVLKAVSRVRDNAGTLEIYRPDAVTIKMSQTVTTDAGNDPIDELTAGV